MFNKLTPRAQQVLMLAKNMALKMKQNYLGTEHLLLGLLEARQSVAVRVLQRLGLDVETVHDALQKHIISSKDSIEGVYLDKIISNSTQEIPLTPRVRQVFELARKVAKEWHHSYVGTEHLLLGLLEEGSGIGAKILKTLDIDFETCRKEILSELLPENIKEGKEDEEDDEEDEDEEIETEEVFSAPELFGKRPLMLQKGTRVLNSYGVELTAKAKEGKLDPVVGREKEIANVIQVLCRRTKHNPVLVGEAGVGKTAIVEGLAQRIVQGNVPDLLIDKKIFILDLALMLSGTKYRGQFEERLKNVMQEVKENPNIILFLDEMHTVVGAGSSEGSMDASNILKPALARGEIQCIGASTVDEYRRYIEKDTALNRRFQSIRIEPSTSSDTVTILKGIKAHFEQFHHVRLSDKVISEAVSLTDRYISDRFFPDKAIDLIDEAGARAHIRGIKQPFSTEGFDQAIKTANTKKIEAIKTQNFEAAAQYRDEEQAIKKDRETKIEAWRKTCQHKVVDIKEELLKEIIFDWTGIPLEWLGVKEADRYLQLDKHLARKVIGQEEAIEAVARALKRSRVDMKDPRRPIGSFLFLGPTGVGKTHLVKILAEELFGNRNSVIQIDMSEYMEKHAVARLIGSPPGYVGHEEGGQLTEAVRKKPYSIILFDEIEKAHPDVAHILLQVLEEGHLTDTVGRTVDFKNTIIVMTSNVGAEALQSNVGLGFNIDTGGLAFERLKERVREASKSAFKPEFLNRISDIVIFRPLERSHIQQIVDLELKQVIERLEAKDIKLRLTEKAKTFLCDKGFDDKYGARPLKRAIEHHVEDLLADALLSRKIKTGQQAMLDVDMDSNHLKFSVKKANKFAHRTEKMIK